MTRTVCVPSGKRPLYGEPHGAKARPSTLQAKLEPATFAANATFALCLLVFGFGAW